MLLVGLDVVLPSLERSGKDPWCWLYESRIGLGPKARTGLVLR